MYYIYDAADPECSYGLFEKEEDARIVCDYLANYLADDPKAKECYTDEMSEDGVYYFIVDLSDGSISTVPFIDKDEAIEHAEANDITPYEIHGHKLNSIYSGNDSIDENGEIKKPEEDDMDSSFYNLALELKEKGVKFEYFVQDYAEGTVQDDEEDDWYDDEE